MPDMPSREIRLFGTDEPVTPPRVLRAGTLSVELDAGNLRYIRLGGTEVLRAISFILRDRNWGTYAPSIENLKIKEDTDSFSVAYEATCMDDTQELRYTAQITGHADGALRFDGVATGVTDFLTNRAGFVVLHGVEGVSGRPAEVLHVDGSVERASFPELIDPVQPFKDIRALTHQPLPGVRVTCTMEGDTFEMEDQRNWSDASYKTYVRPLSAPWPYTIAAGETVSQSVSLAIDGPLPAPAEAASRAVTVTVGEPAGPMPQIGLALAPEHIAATAQAADLIKRAGPQLLVCHFDPRAGHGAEEMAAFRSVGEAVDASLVLEAIVPCQEIRDGELVPSASDTIMRADIAAIAAAVRDSGTRFAAVSVSPASDLKCTLPGTTWPETPPLAEIYAAARDAFPEMPIGGGMFSYFTEINRKHPPAEALDFVTHTTSALVHAADDVSVTESLESLPYIVKTVRSFIGETPYRVGPSGIGMRQNPYGASYLDNPHNGRVAMAKMDPRQRGLLGAAWTLGYIAHMARGGIEAVTAAAPVGEFGIAFSKMDYAQPWFDETGGVYPVFHVIAGMARAAGAPSLQTGSSAGRDVQAVACARDGGTELWLANLVGEPCDVAISGLAGRGRLHLMDEESFVTCTAGPDGFAGSAGELATGGLTLKPYAIARVIWGG